MVDVARSRALSAKSGNGKLPPISNPPHAQSSENILEEYTFEIKRLKEENVHLSNGKEVFEKQTKSVVVENQMLAGKLNNLEHVFSGMSETSEKVNNQYTITNVRNK